VICYFPTPYPDELWYSVCARFSDRMKFRSETGVMQALYGRRHAVATADLPQRLIEITSQLPPGHPCTPDAIIDHHTILPYYSPFLTRDKYAEIRRFMREGCNSSISVRCGACTNRVRPPRFFRSCPLCDREHRRRYGETYWRRLFQLPGVAVCPEHKIFLTPSNIRLDPLPNRHKYFSAESARLGGSINFIQETDPSHLTLLGLARQILWLLEQNRLNPGLELLHENYRDALIGRGSITECGSVRMDSVKAAVANNFTPELLEALQSSLPAGKEHSWLHQLLRKKHTVVAPLRHLLLLQALDISVAEFLQPRSGQHPAAEPQQKSANWVCFNKICEHYGKGPTVRLERRYVDHGVLRAVVKCRHCEYTYLIVDADMQIARPDRVVDYGFMWTESLVHLWNDSTVSLRAMGQKLGVDPATVKYQAKRLDLLFPRHGTRVVSDKGIYIRRPTPAKPLASQRADWDLLRSTNPSCTAKELRSLNPALYAWLYRRDRQWLAANQPPVKKASAAKDQVDWAARDEELVGRIATIAKRLQNWPDKPLRITITAIGRMLGKQSLFESALRKLPLTRSVIESVVESREAFAIRRVHMAAAALRSKGEFPRWKLVRAAGLHRCLERNPDIEIALDYEMRPTSL
jgi:hypothetical protein